MSVVDETTKNALLRSPRWENELRKYSVLAVADAGVIDMGRWSLFDHEKVRLWAKDAMQDMPNVLKVELEKVKAAS